MFRGTYTALVTPFHAGRIDFAALAHLVKRQSKSGIAGVVPVGTTGESPTLEVEEHIEVIARTVEYAGGKLCVIAGTGANSTREAIYLTQAAERAGADASLQVAPYYNKPSQEGLYQHFRAIARATQLPIILYNVPSRCAVEIGVDTVRRLHLDCPNIVGIKEAGGSVDRVAQLRSVTGRRFAILSGDDSLTLPFLAVGATGVISVASNVIPREMNRLVRAALAGDSRLAARLHTQYFPLFKDLFLETNPVPVKAALAMLGLIHEEYRLPLVPLTPAHRRTLENTLAHCGLRPAAANDGRTKLSAARSRW